MSLSKVLEEMSKVRPLAEENVDSGPIETLGARRGRQKRAAETLKDLHEQYSDALMRSAVFILTVGSEREAFEAAVTGDGSGLLSKAESFYDDLASRIHPTLYAGKNPGANLFDVVGRHLEDKAREIGMREYPQLLFKSQYARMVNSAEEFASLLKVAVTEQVGGEVVGINAVKSLTEKAIANNHNKTVTPILLSSADQKFSVELISHLQRLTPNVFLVIAGEVPSALKSTDGAVLVSEISAKSVKNALKQMRNNIKK